MPDAIEVIPIVGPVQGRIRPPGSKSLTNRALIVAALAQGVSRLQGVLDSQDTRVMIDSLQRLGLQVRQDAAACTAEITGCGGQIPNSQADLWLENSGTSIRFLTAMCALGHGRYRLVAASWIDFFRRTDLRTRRGGSRTTVARCELRTALSVGRRAGRG